MEDFVRLSKLSQDVLGAMAADEVPGERTRVERERRGTLRARRAAVPHSGALRLDPAPRNRVVAHHVEMRSSGRPRPIRSTNVRARASEATANLMPRARFGHPLCGGHRVKEHPDFVFPLDLGTRPLEREGRQPFGQKRLDAHLVAQRAYVRVPAQTVVRGRRSGSTLTDDDVANGGRHAGEDSETVQERVQMRGLRRNAPDRILVACYGIGYGRTVEIFQPVALRDELVSDPDALALIVQFDEHVWGMAPDDVASPSSTSRPPPSTSTLINGGERSFSRQYSSRVTVGTTISSVLDDSERYESRPACVDRSGSYNRREVPEAFDTAEAKTVTCPSPFRAALRRATSARLGTGSNDVTLPVSPTICPKSSMACPRLAPTSITVSPRYRRRSMSARW